MSNELFKYIDEGASRTVYEINDNLVIKVAKYQEDPASWGIEQCRVELETYIKYGAKLPLCKILVDSSSKHRIIMERVKPYNLMDDITDDYEDAINELVCAIQYYPENIDQLLEMYKNPKFDNFAKKFKESGLTQDEISEILYDVGFENMGEDANGELVILDYGLQD
ncbi:hypothetical protein XbC2_454 [Xanthomonas phage XbC2]|nr:hypothetical protein XbC2_454 [Xanthomonas phage XbC2]